MTEILPFMSELFTQTSSVADPSNPSLQQGLDLIQSGAIGAGVGILGIMFVGIIRDLRISTLLNGIPGLVFASVLSGLGAFFTELAAGADIFSAIVGTVLAAILTFSSQFVPARNEESETTPT